MFDFGGKLPGELAQHIRAQIDKVSSADMETAACVGFTLRVPPDRMTDEWLAMTSIMVSFARQTLEAK